MLRSPSDAAPTLHRPTRARIPVTGSTLPANVAKGRCARHRPGRCHERASIAAKQQRGVSAAEAEGVGEGDIDAAPARLVRDEINGGGDRGIVEVQGRRRHVVANGEYGENRLDRTGGSE